jgi:peptidyl-tRNA hydrolase
VTVDKLRVITRRDLPAGAQAAQFVHGALAFAAEHPEVTRAWMDTSNTIVLLAERDEQDLSALLARAEEASIPTACFTEPDLGGALTAVVLGPGEASRRLTRGLPLALREPAPRAHADAHADARAEFV